MDIKEYIESLPYPSKKFYKDMPSPKKNSYRAYAAPRLKNGKEPMKPDVWVHNRTKNVETADELLGFELIAEKLGITMPQAVYSYKTGIKKLRAIMQTSNIKDK